jgi:DNA-binding transcriptional ArsR family regulator
LAVPKIEAPMIEWSFTPADVARIRFAFSPLAELVRSLIVLRAPARHSLHRSWVRATRPRLAGIDLTELFALIPIQGDTADFLTPPPISPLPDLPAELEMIRRTPPERVVADAADVLDRQSPVFLRISADPIGAAHRLADDLARYWQIAMDGHWPRIQALLEADILWRSRQLADGGAHALFEDLHETVTWDGNALTAADPHHHHRLLSGEGLLLTPSAMCWPAVRKMIEPYQPTITYPARGIATLWETGAPRTSGALVALIGRTRAQLLIALAEPTSTTALARQLSITPGAVSQHLSVLFDAGLATRSRVGRLVLYRRTHSGDALTKACTLTRTTHA